ncbi:MAG: hypothetical protein JWQ60_5761 [Pseudonocardia sp.]|nr:hypothetical protein [Pseudonocardia sp.]
MGFSADELAVVSAAAERAGLAVGAWVGQEIVRVASGVKRSAPAPVWRENAQDLMRLESELMEHRRVLRNVGGNLNDVARHANVTGQLHAATGQVLGLVARVVTQVERTVVAVSDLAVATMATPVTDVATAVTSRSATPAVTDPAAAPAAAPVTPPRPRPTPYPRGRDGVGPA